MRNPFNITSIGGGYGGNKNPIVNDFYESHENWSRSEKGDILSDLSVKDILNDSKAEAYISQDKVRVTFAEFTELINSHDLKDLIKEEKKSGNEVIIKGKLLSQIASCKQKIEQQEYIILWIFSSFIFGMLMQKHLNVSGDKLFLFCLGIISFFFLLWINPYVYDVHKNIHKYLNPNNQKDKKKKKEKE